MQISVCETLGQQFFFPVSEAPTFKSTGGYVWGLCWTCVTLVFACVCVPLVQYRQRPGPELQANHPYDGLEREAVPGPTVSNWETEPSSA